MEKRFFYLGVIVFLSILMLIGFFLPYIVYEDVNYTIPQNYITYGNISRLIFFILVSGVLSFFTFKETVEDDKVNKLHWPLVAISAFMIFTSLRFLVSGIIISGQYEQYTNNLSIAPFYVLVISLLFPAFYFTRLTVYDWFLEKIYNKFKK
jgi:hypothetical protein